MSEDAERKATVFAVAGWVWGTVKGGFNEQQTTSQVIVDAVISMIPIVGDVTAGRDLIAVLIRLSREPERRNDKGEWMLLVILLFALIPVFGGAIKGVGRLLLTVGIDVAKFRELFKPMIEVLNRIGHGNALKWLKELDLEAHVATLRGKWFELTDRVASTMTRILDKMHALLPQSMLDRLTQLRDGLIRLRDLGDRMIPESLKELNKRLKAIQQHIYQGEWREIPASMKSATREAEARVVIDSHGKKAWTMEHSHFPPNADDVYVEVQGWPSIRHHARAKELIPAFSGPVRPVFLKPGQKIYRVLDVRTRRPLGLWWTHELPTGGRVWREDLAVLEDWSKNEIYIELTVPSEGLRAWEGKAASQIDPSVGAATSGQYLKGGGVQLMVDFNFSKNAHAVPAVSNSPIRPTGWNDHLGVDIPAPGVVTQQLGEHEVATKVYPAPTLARVSAKSAGHQDNQPSQ